VRPERTSSVPDRRRLRAEIRWVREDPRWAAPMGQRAPIAAAVCWVGPPEKEGERSLRMGRRVRRVRAGWQPPVPRRIPAMASGRQRMSRVVQSRMDLPIRLPDDHADQECPHASETPMRTSFAPPFTPLWCVHGTLSPLIQPRNSCHDDDCARRRVWSTRATWSAARVVGRTGGR
jgi:hypothetical protein